MVVPVYGIREDSMIKIQQSVASCTTVLQYITEYQRTLYSMYTEHVFCGPLVEPEMPRQMCQVLLHTCRTGQLWESQHTYQPVASWTCGCHNNHEVSLETMLC